MNKIIIVVGILAVIMLSGCSQSSQQQGTIERYSEGDTITGLTGAGEYAGQAMTIKVANTNSDSATFQLFNSAGELVHTTRIGPGKGDLNFTMKELGTMVFVNEYGTDYVELIIDR